MARRTRSSFRRDTRAVEGFMTEIPALAVVTFAITAFMVSAIQASTLYIEDVERTDSLDRAEALSDAIVSHPKLVVDGRSHHLSATALDLLASDDLTLDLSNTGDMTVVVIEMDIGHANGEAARSWRYTNTERHDLPKAAVGSTVLVGDWDGTGPPVYRLAHMEVRTW